MWEQIVEYWNIFVDLINRYVVGVIAEINTGAISRGYRNEPYPSNQILEYIKSKGGYFILSSDSHSKENIAYQYDKWKGLL